MIKDMAGKAAAVLGLLLFTVITLVLCGILTLKANPAVTLMGAYGLYVGTAALFIILNKRYCIKALYTVIGLFLLTFLYQLIFSLVTVMTFETDLSFYFNNAVNYANSGFVTPQLYQAVFPTTATYPAFLSFFMRIFGTGRLVPVIINQIAMSSLSCLSYFFLRRYIHESIALAGAFLICLHPFAIIYANTCNAELIFGVLMLSAFFASVKAKDSKSLRGRLLWLALSAVLCGVSNLFRPLGIIMIIALGICILLYSRDRFRSVLLSTAVLLVTFLLVQLGTSLWQQQITHYPPAANGFGWNLYIGASPTGRWNQADSDEFAAVFAQADTPSEVHSYFAQQALERYRAMGSGVFMHGLRKLFPWYSAEYMAGVAARQSESSFLDSSGETKTYFTLISLVDVPVFLLSLAVCLWLLLSAMRSRTHDILPLVFYLLGSFLVLMVVEVAPRYTVSYRMVFCVLTAMAVGMVYNHLAAKKRAVGQDA